MATIIVLSRRLADPMAPDPSRPFDAAGAVRSAVGMFFIVFGILQADTNTVLMTVLLLLLVRASSRAVAFAPGLLLIGLGLGLMLTPSVNLVQSSFPEEQQGEISGLSRSISNLGSSFGTAIASTILVSGIASGNGSYVAAMIVLAAFALIGLATSLRLAASLQQPG